MDRVNFAAVNAAALGQLRSLVAEWLPGGRVRGAEWKAADLSGAPGDSLSVNCDSGKWADFATGERGGDPVSLFAAVRGIEQGQAARELALRLGVGGNGAPARAPAVASTTKPAKLQDAEWVPICPVPRDAPEPPRSHPKLGPYTERFPCETADGGVFGFECHWRTPGRKKGIQPLVFCAGPKGARAWRFQGLPAPRPLFGLRELAALPDAPILIVEGPRKRMAALRMLQSQPVPVVVIAWWHGSKAYRENQWEPLRGRAIAVWPDRDAQGEECMMDLGRLLAPTAKTDANGAPKVRIVEVPEGPADGFDLWNAEHEGRGGDWLASWIHDHARALSDYQPRFLAVPERAPKRVEPSPAVSAEPHVPVGDVESAIGELNVRFAFALWGGKAVVLILPRRADDPVIPSTKGDVGQALANRYVRIADSNGKEKSARLFDVWFTHPKRREYSAVDFLPGEAERAGVFNLWTGWPVKAIPGKCESFLQFIHDVIAGGDDAASAYVLAWLAHAIQRPAELPGTAIMLRGKQGIGKGFFAREIGRLFGRHFLQLHHEHSLTGHFNAHLADKLLIFADEAFFAGDPKAAGILNSRITEPSIAVEAKGKDILSLPNFNRIIAATNRDWAVPAALDERRWFAVDVSAVHKRDREYFDGLRFDLDHGGREALFHHLLNLPIEDWNPANYPRTGALREQIEASMEPGVAFWYERLQLGDLDDYWTQQEIEVGCAVLLGRMRDFTEHHPRKIAANNTFLGNLLRRFGVTRFQKRMVMGRVWHYRIADLPNCRSAFEDATGFKPKWPDPDATGDLSPTPEKSVTREAAPSTDCHPVTVSPTLF